MNGSVRISVVVPVYGQWNLVGGLLDRLSRQLFPATEFEVILVADGPGAPPEEPGGARVLTSTGVGSYAARNTGAGAARGEWLAFTDADCRPLPGWLDALATQMAGAGHDEILVGQVVVVPADPRAPGPFEIYEMIRGVPQHRYVRRGFGATANLAVSRAAFARVGGFDSDRFSGGDAEFCRRATAGGMRLRYVADAVVEHPARTTWGALAAKARRLKGGQLAAGPLPGRLVWLARTIAPPGRAIMHYLASRDFPAGQRWLAVAIQLRLWGVELAETVRLLAGGRPERR